MSQLNNEPTNGLEPRTAWGAVIVLYLAGCTTGLHIGKVPVAIPLIREQWQLSLTQTGFIISLYSILIATSGLLLGVLIRRLGYVPFAIVGVGTVGVGALLGSFADGLPLLLIGRSIEGLGWIISVIVLPSLISALSASKDRSFVMAFWASFLPVGAGSMLLLAPQLQSMGGWQLSWWVASAISLLAACSVAVVTRSHRAYLIQLNRNTLKGSYADLAKPVVWLLSGCFFVYSFGYIPLVSYLPLLLVETSSLTLEVVSTIVALVMICNALGSILVGVLSRKGVGYIRLLIIGLMGGGLCALLVFAPWPNTSMRITAAVAFSIVGGIVPGVLFSIMPKAASHPSSVGILVGFMMQLSGTGMLVGGIVVPGVVDLFNVWFAAGITLFLMAVFGAALAYFSGKQVLSV
ncbi:MAG: CynX/NimT family MFS transporter [Granulosicoccus sp.]